MLVALEKTLLPGLETLLISFITGILHNILSLQLEILCCYLFFQYGN